MTDKPYKPYVCRDFYGNELTVEESRISGQPDRFVRVYSHGGSYIRDDAAVNLARALCRAAGRDVIILDRPSMPDVAPAGWHEAGWSVEPAADGRVEVNATVALVPDEARRVAAVLAAYADRAESEPDPHEVYELAREIHLAECGRSRELCQHGLPEPDKDRARFVLRRYHLETR